MRRIIFLCLFFLGALSAFAQNPNRVSIKGILTDTTGSDLPFATLMLLSPKDSALLNFTRSDDKGAFEFKNVKNQPYLLKVSYVGFLPYQQYLDPSPTAENNLGKVAIKPITKELLEVVIKTAKAPLSIKGDTVEYNAASFKVPPGSSVEDLLRRLPGIELDAEGNIKAQGKDVKRVYVDGKVFFADDPKAATRNLGAETISKVQVFNEKSEQSKLTGVDDGKKEKVMNLELKDEYKKGQFGKVSAGAGTSERWTARGNYNRFNSKTQFSILGYGNNINQTGVNWDDYGEFKGQSSFGSQDNGDFGFGNGNNRFWTTGNDVPLNNFDGRGFTKNFGAGSNLNFDNKKTKFNASYFYNQTDLTLQQFTLQQTFFRDSSLFSNDTTQQNNFRGNHSLAMRLEQEIDSNNTLILKGNFRTNTNDLDNFNNKLFYSTNITNNLLSIAKYENQQSWRLATSAIFRHRFKKKGRSLAVSSNYNNSETDGTNLLTSRNQFYRGINPFQYIQQQNNNYNNAEQIKASAIFTDQLRKSLFWELFYNFSQNNDKLGRRTFDPQQTDARIDSLSNYFKNTTQYNRAGTSLRFSQDGINIALGVAAQEIVLRGENAIAPSVPATTAPLKRTFRNFVPNLQTSMDLSSNSYIGLDYVYDITPPQIQDLQTVISFNNPLYLTLGNADLQPERRHNINFNTGFWNPGNMSNLGIWVDYVFTENPIVYNQIIENVPEIGVRTTTRPENVTNQHRVASNIWFGFPIIKTKLTMNGNGGYEYSKVPTYLNSVRNETENNGINFGLRFSYTPDPKLIIEFGGRIRNSYISYSIQKEQNQSILTQTINSAMRWQMLKKTFLEVNFNYEGYQNERFNFNQQLPLLHASVRHLFLKENRLEVRLSGFDILNRRVTIVQNGNQNFISRTTAETLARYFMLTLTYNLKGHESKLKKNNGW